MLRSPLLSFQWPPTLEASFTRTPRSGLTPRRRERSRIDRQLAGRLDHEDAAVAELQRMQGEVDELLVLVAVADDVRPRGRACAQRDEQLGLAAAFEAVVVVRAEVGDLLDDLPLLVDLDREHAAIAAAVVQAGDGAREGLVEQGDLRVEQVLDAQQHRHLQAALLHARDDVGNADADALAVDGHTDCNGTVVPEVEVPGAPVPDAVKFGRICRGPVRFAVGFQFLPGPPQGGGHGVGGGYCGHLAQISSPELITIS